MNININIHHHESNPSHVDMERIVSLLNTINMDQAELAQSLADLKDQTEKSNAEIVGKLASLEQAIIDAGVVSPEVEAALADLKSSVQKVDDIVPDAV